MTGYPLAGEPACRAPAGAMQESPTLGQVLWDQDVTAYWCSSDAGSWLRSCCLPGRGPTLQHQQPPMQRSAVAHHQSLTPGGLQPRQVYLQTAGLPTVMHLQPQATVFWAPITWLWLPAVDLHRRCAAAA